MQSNLPTWYHESKFYPDLTLAHRPPLAAQYNFCNLVLFLKVFYIWTPRGKIPRNGASARHHSPRRRRLTVRRHDIWCCVFTRGFQRGTTPEYTAPKVTAPC